MLGLKRRICGAECLLVSPTALRYVENFKRHMYPRRYQRSSSGLSYVFKITGCPPGGRTGSAWTRYDTQNGHPLPMKSSDRLLGELAPIA
jgi:hypothetical protein